MDKIKKVKFISIWIFIIPFIAVNACLVLITNFHDLFPNKEDIVLNTIPYIDGQVSISRTARVFPTYLIFKPAMFLTSFLLIKYWFYNKEIVNNFKKNHENIKKFIFFGVGSAIFLIIHSIFLGVHFDNNLYKFLRRVVMLSFIIFEIAAQTYLVLTFYSINKKLSKFINQKILKIKLILVSVLIIVAILSIPIISTSGNKFFKHALEWHYFIAVISFYLLTFLMWKNKKK